MDDKLLFLAGQKALARIRDAGLRPDDVKVVAGAAGGPKWLILGHLDRALFGRWFAGRRRPLFLVGASSAAWRFAAASQYDPEAAIDRFQEAYIHQAYETRPTSVEVSRQGRQILYRLLGTRGVGEILRHPCLRLNVMAVRCKGLTAHNARLGQLVGLLLAAGGNLMARTNLRFFFERALFSDPRDVPPFAAMNRFTLHRVPLNPQNLAPGLLASGSIPFLMQGVTGIPAAPAGVYRDGAIIDYHMDIPFLEGQDGIVLFPHYTHRIIPGWFDKRVTWRKPSAAHMAQVLLVLPSADFIARLPFGKIPDRQDFYRLKGDDRTRTAYWQKAAGMGRQLAEAFMAAVESGRIKDRVKPIPPEWVRL